mmetsp:Transcript_9133/g.16392  ORF Transcript_9133/g.16392 Transcript_9133/m.16392 type:complete len:201 (-) Transcript_9133:187-789(-)
MEGQLTCKTNAGGDKLGSDQASKQKLGLQEGAHLLMGLAEAKRLKLDAKIKTLAGRPEIAKLGLSTCKLLEALKSANGSVVQAKHDLLGLTSDGHKKDYMAKRQHCEKDGQQQAEGFKSFHKIEPMVFQEAKRMQLDLKLKALSDNPAVLELGISDSSVLDALKAANGSVVQAKHALLGSQLDGAKKRLTAKRPKFEVRI